MRGAALRVESESAKLLGNSNVPAADSENPDRDPGWKDIMVYSGPAALGHPKEQHSQVGQDWLVGSLTGCKRNGFFLDLAANDAVDLSNSLMLERF